MSFKYLDNNGLQYFWNKIVAKINAEKGVTSANPTTPVSGSIYIPTKTSDLVNDSGFITDSALTGKQDTLVSGTNIKTINNTSLLGSGNITTPTTDVKINNTSIVSSNSANIVTNTAYNSSSNKIATMTDISNSLSSYVAKSGTTMTGILTAQNNTSYTTAQVRNVTFSTSAPTSSQGGNGDIWIVYS